MSLRVGYDAGELATFVAERGKPRRFRIERLCPKISFAPQDRKKMLASLPVIVKLSDLPAHPDFMTACNAKHFFRIDRLEGNKLRAKMGFPNGERDYCICDHMGTLIIEAARTVRVAERKRKKVDSN